MGLAQVAVGLVPVGPPISEGDTTVSFNYAHAYQLKDYYSDWYPVESTIDYALVGFDYRGGDNSISFLLGLGRGEDKGSSLDSSIGVLGGVNWKYFFPNSTLFLSSQLFVSSFTNEESIGILDYTVDFTYYELQFALGITYMLADSWELYGGPFIHYLAGETTSTISYDDNRGNTQTLFSMDVDIEGDWKFGIFGGVVKSLTDKSNINAEILLCKEAYMLVLRYDYRF